MDNKKQIEQELIKGCINDDRKSQEEFYRLFAPKMYTICLSYATKKDEAMDILQDGFIKVFRNIKKYNGEGSLEGWVRRIIVNTAIDYYRKYKKEISYLDSAEIQISDQGKENVFSNLGLEDILAYLNKLPEGARLIFNLYAVEGYNHREIAEKLNVTEGTSKSQFNRARTLLKEWMGPEFAR
ncbi:RNA polymerase sigma factor [Marivirga sp.]|uniref:RNA polymerase sigma factor n=1 Tax=Marivirga sp. TaxID=2018662 RepID=UPI003DA73608